MLLVIGNLASHFFADRGPLLHPRAASASRSAIVDCEERPRGGNRRTSPTATDLAPAPDASNRKTGTDMTSHRHDAPPRGEQGSADGRGRAGSARASRSGHRSPLGEGGLTSSSGRSPDDAPGEVVTATVAGSLRLAAGLGEQERPLLVRRLARLDTQLARYRADRVDLELSVKDRGTRGQRMTLECWIAGRPRLVASSAAHDLETAVGRVREGMRRQLDDTATRREPRNNRLLRRSARTDPGTPLLEPDVLAVDVRPAIPSPEAR